MPTQTMYFKGKVKWCNHNIPNEWNKYNTRFYPIEEDKERIKKLPIMNQWKEDGPDGEYTNISCPTKREWRGQVIQHKIDVRDETGAPLEGGVGDGSDVVLKAEYYTYRQGKGHALKWVGLQVMNLVPKDEITGGVAASEYRPF